MPRVMNVDSVCYGFEKKLPPNLVIDAQGEVPTSGWTSPRLSIYVYIQPPADGIQDFDFIATAPSGIVLQVISPISAQTTLQDIDVENYWGPGMPLKGIRVHSASNKIEVVFGKGDQGCVKDTQSVVATH